MVDLQQPTEITLGELEAKRRQAEKALAQLQAPGRALEAAQAQLAAIEDQIATAQATAEAQRRAEQQRQDETAALQRRYDDLCAPIAFGMMELREVALLAHRLRERGIEAAPITWNLEEVARPWVEQQALIRAAMRQPTQPAPVAEVEDEAEETENNDDRN